MLPFIKFQWQVKLGKKWANWRIGKDEFAFATTRTFRASFNSCDTFGAHLSNSEYAVCLDHVRGPFAFELVGEAYGVRPTAPELRVPPHAHPLWPPTDRRHVLRARRHLDGL